MSIEVQISKLIESLDRNTVSNSQLFGLLSNNVNAKAPAPTPSGTDSVAGALIKPVPLKKRAAAAPTPPPADPTPPAATTAADEDFDFDAPSPEEKKLTVDDARQALVKLQKAKGSAEASRGILKANGLASLASLKDDQQELIAKIIAACDAATPKG
jgi:hypothetical protein